MDYEFLMQRFFEVSNKYKCECSLTFNIDKIIMTVYTKDKIIRRMVYVGREASSELYFALKEIQYELSKGE